MNQQERMSLAGALALLLATAALVPLFDGTGWLLRVAGAVLVVVAAGVAGRRVGVPALAQPLVSAALLAAYLVVVFAGSSLTYGVLPGGGTVKALEALIASANADVLRFRAPVPSSDGLVLLAAAGAGVAALLLDLLAVGLERPALAGVPVLALLVVPSAVVPGGVGAVPFATAAAGWLLLLAVEGNESVSRWGSSVTTGGQSGSLMRLSRRIGVSALGTALVVPLLVPGLDKTLIGGTSPDGAGSATSSSARTYNPITRLQQQLTLPDPVELLQYRTDDPSPDYIRLTTLDRYDGAGWSASPLEQKREDAQVQKGIARPVGEDGPHQPLRMTLAIAPSLSVYWLPLPFGPSKVEVDGPWLWDPPSHTAFSAARTTKGLAPYRVEANRVLPDRSSLDRADSLPVDRGVQARYGRPVRVTRYVDTLTRRVTAGARSDYDRALALQAFLTDAGQGFRYDLTPPRAGRGQDPLEVFLRGRRGFCEQYATAMAAMLRVAGVPSRVAVGFTRGTLIEQEAQDRTFSVSTQNAHAWPEAWFPGTGWVRFEPTPGESGASVPDYAQPEGAAPVTPQPSTGPTQTPSAAPTERSALPEERDLIDDQVAAGDSGGGILGTLVRVLAVTAAVLALGAVPWALTRLRRARRWSEPNGLTAWEQLQEDAADVGHRWRPGDSPRTAAAGLASIRKLTGAPLEALDRVAAAAERARYGRPGTPLSDAQHRALATDVATVRTAVWRTATRWERWRALLLPPSTLHWATSGLGDRVETTMERVDDRIARTTRRLSPRG